ncbi:MAG: hypothetical protein LBE49_03960, partial [Deltaproteobacteria bacterium]|nr:hypothetical protein [Deltaproteobacteria bacterium]
SGRASEVVSAPEDSADGKPGSEDTSVKADEIFLEPEGSLGVETGPERVSGPAGAIFPPPEGAAIGAPGFLAWLGSSGFSGA